MCNDTSYLTDAAILELCRQIVDNQEDEIQQMKALLAER
jgi:uncharacterized protein (DUF305 family)